jgi:hypothetical protein
MQRSLVVLLFVSLPFARAGDIESIRIDDYDEHITLRADGTAEYEFRGHNNWHIVDERTGIFRGKLDPREFKRLALLPGAEHFMDMKDFYLPYSTHIVRTTVVRDGKSKRLERHDRGVLRDPEPPRDLWDLEMAVRGLATRVRWEALPSGVRVRIAGLGEGLRWVMVRELSTNLVVAFVETMKDEVEFPVRPGKYRIEVSLQRDNKVFDAWKRTVEVKADAYTPVSERQGMPD